MANIWRYLDTGYKAGYKADIISLEGSMIDTTASSYDLNQLIQEPPHIFNSSSSCIDLIFFPQRNLVMESGIHSLLHWRFHYQIVFAKLNLSIFCPPYLTRELSAIMKNQMLNLSEWLLISFTGWEPSLINFLSKMLLNIMKNLNPHERIWHSNRIVVSTRTCSFSSTWLRYLTWVAFVFSLFLWILDLLW